MTRVEMLEQVSESCDTLTGFAVHAAQQAEGRTQEQYGFHVVQSLAERIGAIASLAAPNPRDMLDHLVGSEELVIALLDARSTTAGAS